MPELLASSSSSAMAGKVSSAAADPGSDCPESLSLGPHEEQSPVAPLAHEAHCARGGAPLAACWSSAAVSFSVAAQRKPQTHPCCVAALLSRAALDRGWETSLRNSQRECQDQRGQKPAVAAALECEEAAAEGARLWKPFPGAALRSVLSWSFSYQQLLSGEARAWPGSAGLLAGWQGPFFS